jgi:hypothetical protein
MDTIHSTFETIKRTFADMGRAQRRLVEITTGIRQR